MAGRVKVSSETLRTKAAEVDVALPTLPPGPQAPSALKISQDATNLIKDNLNHLKEMMSAGRRCWKR